MVLSCSPLSYVFAVKYRIKKPSEGESSAFCYRRRKKSAYVGSILLCFCGYGKSIVCGCAAVSIFLRIYSNTNADTPSATTDIAAPITHCNNVWRFSDRHDHATGTSRSAANAYHGLTKAIR